MTGPAEERLTADVLVIGGGPAGAWAAWSAASHGARTVLADKGYLGTSGATAPGGTGFLYVEPDREKREKAVAERLKSGGFLSESPWIYRLMEQAYLNIQLVEKWGYRFPLDENGNLYKSHMQGPEYMELMRRVVRKAGVTILDQHPALELLVDEHGVGGARGVNRLTGGSWEVRANAVVIATGGCAFLSKGLGCNVQTGDGQLMASELGVEMSGMEFSRQYATTAAFSTITRNRVLGFASFYDGEGNLIHEGGPREDHFFAKHLAQGPVYAKLTHGNTPEKQAIIRASTPLWFVPFDRAGIDPFTQSFPIQMRYEGTIRGTGGIRLTGDYCQTSVQGLFAAGDAASREKTAGAKSGGGAYNASWAIASGTWSGKGAAEHALAQGKDASHRNVKPAGRHGLAHTADSTAPIPVREVVKAVQDEMFPLRINYFRSEPVLAGALERLDRQWPLVQGAVGPSATGRVQAREAAAMVANARWMYTAALIRKETRGMHTMAEYPELDDSMNRRLLLSGIERIAHRWESVPSGGQTVPPVTVKEGLTV
ncbi:FAD-dependent oxidoreductase [Paenibacillus soyae]|uniref:FAD-binding protein n=1 Tax=Paenibacillus soyae TaxID=2969249 RepID=A0A9X2MR06_9BACL|nr:FAD-binding protein [Paenibacillus soyae]MCR2804677.1 FAD-binding protein [Paenibacillus soyae]